MPALRGSRFERRRAHHVGAVASPFPPSETPRFCGSGDAPASADRHQIFTASSCVVHRDHTVRDPPDPRRRPQRIRRSFGRPGGRAFVAALVLFAIPVTLLGMVSPFALRLALRRVEHAGEVSGRPYALSTVGSIVGTFVSALVTIEAFGTRRTMMGTAVLRTSAAALVLGRSAVPAPLLLAALLFVPPGAVKSARGLLYEAESPHQYVLGRPSRRRRARAPAERGRRVSLRSGASRPSLTFDGCGQDTPYGYFGLWRLCEFPGRPSALFSSTDPRSRRPGDWLHGQTRVSATTIVSPAIARQIPIKEAAVDMVLLVPNGLSDGRLRTRGRRHVLLLVGRPVFVPSAAAVHEEHGHRASKQEEQENESCGAHSEPPSVMGY